MKQVFLILCMCITIWSCGSDDDPQFVVNVSIEDLKSSNWKIDEYQLEGQSKVKLETTKRILFVFGEAEGNDTFIYATYDERNDEQLEWKGVDFADYVMFTNEDNTFKVEALDGTPPPEIHMPEGNYSITYKNINDKDNIVFTCSSQTIYLIRTNEEQL